jgi:aldehyde dehydrogenase (NAD+)
MSSEIFGPILAILPVDDVNEAIRIIRGRPTPLAIYIFTENNATTDLCKLHRFILFADTD